MASREEDEMKKYRVHKFFIKTKEDQLDFLLVVERVGQ